ncbi:phosphatase PAP2 family protein [Ramlibacter albus]|uniref:Phosphatase PAP2 family protein n=1 Tax=Ramlibacter albus TaxID=2079448 RepID=A0A923S8J4_9BURK|nr:phosphatase PAP2 family protein [Ramlibacter albus]MBC5768157.1 phosphatase PAP2 family protein [Ramlibacter albus]
MTTFLRIAAASAGVLVALSAQAQTEISRKDRFGQVMRVALPAAAMAVGVYHDDMEGVRQLVFSTALAAGSTEVLKKLVREERPDGREKDSFPSGHAAVTFAAAGFVHQRYSLQWALPFYALATATAYKRVHTHNHFTRDVVAGAAVGVLSSWAFTGRYTTPRSTASIGYFDKAVVLNYTHTW